MRDVWGLHTKDRACRDWLFIYPEGHLGEDYCHYAGDIRLNHEVAHFSFQVEVDCHHHIFTWSIKRNEVVWLTQQDSTLRDERFSLQTDVTFDFYLIWLLLYTLVSSPVSLSILTRAGDNLLQCPAAKIVSGAAVYRAERSSKMLRWC